MIRLKDIKLIHLSGGASLGIFSILLLALLLPIATSEVNAESNLADNSAMQVGLIATPVVAIGIDQPEINFEFQPKKDGEFKTNATTVTVSTNQIDGYKILLSTENGKLTNFVTGESVNSITSNNISISDISMNSWGYNITPGIVSPSDQTTYNAIPVDATVIQDVTGEVIDPRNDQFTLSFGTKIDTSLPAGNYSSKVVVSAVANPIKITNMMQLTYMQDMTAEFCKNTRGTDGNTTVTVGHEPTKRLIDVRDGKKYWVAKLADQNCWMTQNLALDIPATGLKAADTDITTDWNRENNQKYPPKATTTVLLAQDAVADPVSESDGVRSWDFGEWILTDPTRIGDEGCTLAVGQNFTSCNRLKAYDSETDDAHYLLGNYYQFNTAVAGSIGSNINIEATQSICPKNWKLPTSNNTNPGSIFYLLDQYGLTNIAINEGTGFSLASAPLFINREGNVWIQQPQLIRVGGSGGFWSGTAAYRPDYAYNLHLDRTVDYVQPSGNNNLGRMNGRSIRCLVR